jgi:hypothetical protein
MQRFALEHFIPRSQGGTTSLDNLALACQGCNNHKYNKIQSGDPVTNQLVELFHPRTQRWQDHFTWDERFERIIGLTATGRAMVEALQLNRPELINLRQLLYAAGEHPLPEEALDRCNITPWVTAFPLWALFVRPAQQRVSA